MKSRLRYHSLYSDACALLARNIYDLLGLSGLEISRDNALRIVDSLPLMQSDFEQNSEWRRELFNQVMVMTEEKCREVGERERFQELTQYFVAFVERAPDDQDHLIAAFRGVLSQKWGGL